MYNISEIINKLKKMGCKEIELDLIKQTLEITRSDSKNPISRENQSLINKTLKKLIPDENK